MKRNPSPAFVFAAALAMPCAAWAAPDYYRASPASGKYATALALNDVGRYGINSTAPDVPYYLASIGGGGMSESLGSLGGDVMRIWALNNAGEAVGDSSTPTGEFHAFLYSAGRMHDLRARYGFANPVAINDRGEIAGRTLDNRAAVLRNGFIDDFGPPQSGAGDINEKGQVLFDHAPEGVAYRAAVYSGGRLHDLPRFAGNYVSGRAINDAGWVTGHLTTAIGRYHAYVYDGGTVTDLTPWSVTSFGFDINNLGQVVGTVDGRAFLYEDRILIDLNTLIDPRADLLLTEALAINDRGQILARACDRAGVFCYDTMLLDPVPAVPEPAHWATLAAGLAVLGAARRSRVRAGR